MSKKPLFVTGIGTGVGKTVVSAILVEKLKADYWKPVQSGDLHHSDTLAVQGLVSNPTTVFHPEAYHLTQPYSPHKSAALDGIIIDPGQILLPQTNKQLIIEGAGGLMVPLNDHFFMIDLIKKLNAEVALVCKHYLGSINHTLLSIEALKAKGIPLKHIIFSGVADADSERVILTQLNHVAVSRVPALQAINKQSIQQAANDIEFLTS